MNQMSTVNDGSTSLLAWDQTCGMNVMEIMWLSQNLSSTISSGNTPSLMYSMNNNNIFYL